jgi:membrane protein YqaA with SNARE-associated domain
VSSALVPAHDAGAVPAPDAGAVPAHDAGAVPAPASRFQRLLPLIFSLTVTVAAAPLAIFVSQQTGELGTYGILAYPMLFVLQALVSATIFLPAPGLAVVAAAGTFLDPIGAGIVAGLGSATGELSGYLLGYFGRRAVPTDTSRLWRLAERGFRRWGFIALVVLAAIPNPAFDALGILAGSLRYPLGRFWLSTAAGKVMKFCLVSYLSSLLSVWMLVK